ncbi:unnamed protein product (macronuclear) [Paramecium tetraurelia]|uniref:Uncharacterized protein n=1 Tax=Paramecium tetraurelia TaxID=5888 RepID=A0D7F6_PARTE|nr:uncharacterized protein GSPATT00002015001 [Paramecium tetraurelia]CAK78973.1 unnamed protein product [Paramecium tetraurelia]|eukprot:XP_001446370.1 hypothetical protein (macronuclear) [Paramecium tetraurelia strain d4-2]
MYKPSRSLRQSQEKFYTNNKPSPQTRAVSFATTMEEPLRLINREFDRDLYKQKLKVQEAELLEAKGRHIQFDRLEQQSQICIELNEQRLKNKQQQQVIENLEFKLQIEKKDSLIYQQQVQRLEEQYNYLQDNYDTQKQQIIVLQESIEQIQKKNNLEKEMRSEKEFLQEKEIKFQQSEIKRYQEEIVKQREHILQNSQQQNANEFILILENKFELVQKEFIFYKKEKEQEIEGMKQLIDSYQSQIQRLNKENQLLLDKQSIISTTEEHQQQIKTLQIELESQIQICKQLNQQITILQQQLNQTNLICQNLKEEKLGAIKEKQAIETYYLDQLQKQDVQLSQMIKSSVQNEQKAQIQKLQIIIEQKDLMIRELSMQKDCNCNKQIKNEQKVIIRDLEKKNATLVMEVERLNKILKQKLTELENQTSRSCEENHKKYLEEIDIWKSKFLSINKQYHISQEQLMVVKTELDGLKKAKQKENIDPILNNKVG